MKILNHLKLLSKTLMRTWKGPKTGIQLLSLLRVSMILPKPVFPRTPVNIATRIGMEVTNPLPNDSVEGKQRKRKSQESDIYPGITYKTFIKSKVKVKFSPLQALEALRVVRG
jgi:hypothetical protein